MQRHMIVSYALLSTFLCIVVGELSSNAAFTESVSSQKDVLEASSTNENMSGSLRTSNRPHPQIGLSNPVMIGAFRSKEAQIQIQSLFAYLRSFIYDTHFDAVSFEKTAYSVAQQLFAISSFKRVAWHNDDVFARQFTFVSTVYEAMESAMHELNTYAFLGSKENKLLNRMIEIDIRVLALHDSSGNLDKSIPRYAARIAECWRLLCLCGNAFDDLLEVSKEIRDIFDFHRLRAEENIGALWRQVPVEDFVDTF